MACVCICVQVHRCVSAVPPSHHLHAHVRTSSDRHRDAAEEARMPVVAASASRTDFLLVFAPAIVMLMAAVVSVHRSALCSFFPCGLRSADSCGLKLHNGSV